MTDADQAEAVQLPSWLRWPPNGCETCVSWQSGENFVGRCENQNSTHAGDETDSRFRCQDFKRKA